jgi:hypothetical protein
MPIIAGRASAAYGGGFGAITTPGYQGPFGAYDALATVTVGATAVSTINFVGIPTGYKHLQIRYLSRCSRATPADGLSIRLNGDTGSNYARHIVYNSEPTLGVETLTSQTLANFAVHTAATAPANVFGAGIIDILDYSSLSKTKTMRSLAGIETNSATDLRMGSGLWFKTPEAITSITFLAESGSSNFVQYSSFSLYGVK